MGQPETPKIDTFEGLAGGLSVAILGSPGTGKSTFAGSVGKYCKTKLLATKPREANSWMYRETGIYKEAEIFHDPKWRPSAGLWEATGYNRLIRRLWELYEDKEYEAVILDPFTDVVDLAAQEILKSENAASPRDMRDSMSFYGTLKYKLAEVVDAMTALQFAPKPKHVIVTVHTQPAKEDSSRPNGPAPADKTGAGVEYEGRVLPAIEGGYRRVFAGEFDVVMFSDVRTKRRFVTGKPPVEEVEYFLQATPDADRHAKSVLGPVLATKEIPNDFGEMLRIIRGGTK